MGNCSACVDPEVDRKNEAFISPNKMRCEDNKDKFKRNENNKENLSPMANCQMTFDKHSTPPQKTLTSKKYEDSVYLPKEADNELIKSTKADHESPHIPKDLPVVVNMPDYSNINTQATIKSMQPFTYDLNPENAAEFENLPFYGPVFIDDRSIYEGQWKHGKRHGLGKQNWTDGSVYEGYWLNDMANIYGRLIHSDGDVYEGEWQNDKAQGKGVYIHKDGARYEGDWFEDKQHGQGKENWTDGASYEGGYKYGMKHGFGIFHWVDGSNYYGEFIENNIEGKGKYVWADGREYEGEWKENKMHGRGVFLWKDGKRYEGEYVEDKKCGYGVFEWPDGRSYRGNWVNGKQDGLGLFKEKEQSEEREGLFKNGNLVMWVRKQ